MKWAEAVESAALFGMEICFFDKQEKRCLLVGACLTLSLQSPRATDPVHWGCCGPTEAVAPVAELLEFLLRVLQAGQSGKSIAHIILGSHVYLLPHVTRDRQLSGILSMRASIPFRKVPCL